MEKQRLSNIVSLALIASFLLASCSAPGQTSAKEQEGQPPPAGSDSVPDGSSALKIKKGGEYREVAEVFPALGDWQVDVARFNSGGTEVDVFEFSPENVDMVTLSAVHQSFSQGFAVGKTVNASFDGQEWDISGTPVPAREHDVFIVPDNAPLPAAQVGFTSDTRAMTWGIDDRQVVRSIIETTPPQENGYLKDPNANFVYNAVTEFFHATTDASAAPTGQKSGVWLVDDFKAQEAAAMTWGLGFAMKAQGWDYAKFSETMFGMPINVPYADGSGSFEFTITGMSEADYNTIPPLRLLP